eukprot:jgi/Psemu1/2356/gm1.2356_g
MMLQATDIFHRSPLPWTHPGHQQFSIDQCLFDCASSLSTTSDHHPSDLPAFVHDPATLIQVSQHTPTSVFANCPLQQHFFDSSNDIFPSSADNFFTNALAHFPISSLLLRKILTRQRLLCDQSTTNFDWNALTNIHFSFDPPYSPLTMPPNTSKNSMPPSPSSSVDFLTRPIAIIRPTIVDAVMASLPYYYAMCKATSTISHISLLLAQFTIRHVAEGRKTHVQNTPNGKRIICLELNIEHWAFQPEWTQYLFDKVYATPSVLPTGATRYSQPVGIQQ